MGSVAVHPAQKLSRSAPPGLELAETFGRLRASKPHSRQWLGLMVTLQGLLGVADWPPICDPRQPPKPSMDREIYARGVERWRRLAAKARG
jgi:hypothetical protein